MEDIGVGEDGLFMVGLKVVNGCLIVGLKVVKDGFIVGLNVVNDCLVVGLLKRIDAGVFERWALTEVVGASVGIDDGFLKIGLTVVNGFPLLKELAAVIERLVVVCMKGLGV